MSFDPRRFQRDIQEYESMIRELTEKVSHAKQRQPEIDKEVQECKEKLRTLETEKNETSKNLRLNERELREVKRKLDETKEAVDGVLKQK